MRITITATAFALCLATTVLFADSRVNLGPLAQSFFPDDDDDRPELFTPSVGDSDPSNFEPREGDSDPANFEPRDGDSNSDRYESPDLDELAQARPARKTAGRHA